jgi:hypothetical protein
MMLYVGDLQKDPAFRRCSRTEKGMLLELLLLMHECEVRGVLATAGKAWPDDEVGRAAGGDMNEAIQCLRVLLEKKVLQRDERGAIFSRRMVRDESKRRKCSAAGKRGGNPRMISWRTEPGFVYAMQRDGAGPIKIGASVDPATRKRGGIGSLSGPGITVLASWPVDQMGPGELCIHELFSDRCVGGEWFDITVAEFPLIERELTLKGHLKGSTKGRSKRKPTPSISVSISNTESAAQPPAGVLPAAPLIAVKHAAEGPKRTTGPPAEPIVDLTPSQARRARRRTDAEKSTRWAFIHWFREVLWPANFAGEIYDFDSTRERADVHHPAVWRFLDHPSIGFDPEKARAAAQAFVDFVIFHRPNWHCPLVYLAKKPETYFELSKQPRTQYAIGTTNRNTARPGEIPTDLPTFGRPAKPDAGEGGRIAQAG